MKKQLKSSFAKIIYAATVGGALVFFINMFVGADNVAVTHYENKAKVKEWTDLTLIQINDVKECPDKIKKLEASDKQIRDSLNNMSNVGMLKEKDILTAIKVLGGKLDLIIDLKNESN